MWRVGPQTGESQAAAPRTNPARAVAGGWGRSGHFFKEAQELHLSERKRRQRSVKGETEDKAWGERITGWQAWLRPSQWKFEATLQSLEFKMSLVLKWLHPVSLLYFILWIYAPKPAIINFNMTIFQPLFIPLNYKGCALRDWLPKPSLFLSPN